MPLNERMPFFAVTYTYSPDADAVATHRPEHRAFLAGLLEAGTLAASGPLPADDGGTGGALILVRATDRAGAVATLDDDPFWVRGLVAQRTVRAWTPVFGPWSHEV